MFHVVCRFNCSDALLEDATYRYSLLTLHPVISQLYVSRTVRPLAVTNEMIGQALERTAFARSHTTTWERVHALIQRLSAKRPETKLRFGPYSHPALRCQVCRLQKCSKTKVSIKQMSGHQQNEWKPQREVRTPELHVQVGTTMNVNVCARVRARVSA